MRDKQLKYKIFDNIEELKKKKTRQLMKKLKKISISTKQISKIL